MRGASVLLLIGWLVLCVQPGVAQSIQVVPLESSSSTEAPDRIPPPQASDTRLVLDIAPGLDTACTFRDDGPLIVQFPIDRYFGTAADRQVLRAGSYLPDSATLTLPVYDLNETLDSTFAQPEYNRLSVNGYTLTPQYLYGAHQQWQMNRFQIPLDWLNFPADPGAGGTLQPAYNEIRLDIDTANTTFNFWCQSLDWLALDIAAPAPVVLLSDSLTDTAAVWEPGLQQAGLVYQVLSTGGVGQPLHEQAAQVNQQLNALRSRWGVQQITLVAQGRSGLSARYLAQQSDAIAQVIQIGTPNQGSSLADALLGSALLSSLPDNSLWSAAALAPLTPDSRERLNRFDVSHTRFVTLAGDYQFGGSGLADALFATLAGDTHDALVSRASAQNVPFAEALQVASSGQNTDALHFRQLASQPIFQALLPYITQSNPVSSAQIARSMLAPVSDTAAQMTLRSHSGTLAPAATDTIQRHINSQQALILLSYSADTPTLTLHTPSGNIITPQTADTLSGVQVIQPDSGLFGYALDAPEPGLWSLSVTGGAVTVDYALTGILFQPQTDITLRASSVPAGESLIYEARVMQTDTQQPLTGQTVIAQIVTPDNTVQTMNLLDDGSGGDTLAGDGIYSGNLLAHVPGTYYAIAQLPGIDSQTHIETPVSNGHATLTGVYSEAVIDTDSNGLYEALLIRASVESDTSGEYVLHGTLYDAHGAMIGSQRTRATLTAGASTMALRFDSTSLKNHPAPFTLQTVYLADASLTLTDSAIAAYSTAAYPADTFNKPPIQITGFQEHTPDSDSDGRYDALTLDVSVHFPEAGRYTWSGALLDVTGQKVSHLSGQIDAEAGTQQIPMSFDGRMLYQQGQDGPYRLADMLFYTGTAAESPASSTTITAAYSHQAFERPLPPADTNLVSNGDFSSGLTGWQTNGTLQTSIYNDALTLHRPSESSGSISQRLMQYVENGLPLEVRLDVQHIGSAERGLLLSLSDPQRIQVLHCAFTLAPGDTHQIVLRGLTRLDWSAIDLHLQPYEPDSTPSLAVDNISVQYTPGTTTDALNCEGSSPPVEQTLFVNGSFTQGLAYWQLTGDYEFWIQSELLNLYRPVNAQQPTILMRDAAYHIPAGQTLQLDVALGNSSSQPKEIALHLRDKYARQGIYCAYTLPAYATPQSIRLHLTTDRHWSQPVMRLDVLTADGAPAVQVDHASLRILSVADSTRPLCGELPHAQPTPTATPPPAIPTKPPLTHLPEAGPVPPEPDYIPPTPQPMPIIGGGSN